MLPSSRHRSPHSSPPAPALTIVMPARNTDQWIAASLASLQSQSIPDWACIVVDDHSSDHTYAVADSFARSDPRIRVTRPPYPVGCGGARNHGLAHSSPGSPLVLFLDSDDILLPNAIAGLVAALDANPAAVAAVGQSLMIDERGAWCNWAGKPAPEPVPLLSPTLPRLLHYPDIETRAVFPPSAILWRRWVVEAAGRFDAELVAWEDRDLLMRVSLWGPVVVTGEVIVHYRRRGGSMTGDVGRMRAGERACRGKWEAYRVAREARSR